MKKWGGQLDIRPPHSKNWGGGRVPPIPPRIDAPVCSLFQMKNFCCHFPLSTHHCVSIISSLRIVLIAMQQVTYMETLFAVTFAYIAQNNTS